jgi:hypothetical protein
MLTAKCPKMPNHNAFIVSAHVVETWRVDEHGNFNERIECTDVTHRPSLNDIWMCAVCGAEAMVYDSE